MTISKLRRLAVAILAAATATAGLLQLAPVPASAVAGFSWDRIDGVDRWDTARRIAVETFGSADTVLLARGDLFPDALAGSYLAGSTDDGAPILLTEVNRLPRATNEALATLGTERIILLGGPNAISASVEAELRSRNFNVERIGGRDRFETSQQIAERLGSSNVGSVDGDRTAVVASGRNFPDALAGGPLSFASRLPSILTDTNVLPQASRNALTNLSISRVFLLGGPAAVSNNVETQLREMGITVERLGGNNRQGTAVIVAETAIDRLGFDDTHINLARGDHFADALTGGPHSGDESDGGTAPGAAPAPIVLALSPTILSSETADFLTSHSGTLRDGHIFGGFSAISQAVEDEAARAAGAGRAVVTLDNTTVEQGGAITGNVQGNPQRVFVSGCGLNERELGITTEGDFSVVIPDSQPAGACTITFRLTFQDGSSETESFGITVTEPVRAATDAPELLSVSFVRTFSQPTGGEAFDQTVMRFTFDEPVTGQPLFSAGAPCTETQPGCSLKFKLYRFDQRVAASNPSRVYSGRAAQIDSSDTNSVLVTFGQAQSLTNPNPGEVGAAELVDVTVGAVQANAVRDGSNVPNPFGDAGFNALVFGPGGTTAPDLVGVENFRPSFDGTRTLVDFVFDEPAERTANPSTPGGYVLVQNDADVTQRECNFQEGPTGPGTPTTGRGTTIHTVSCPQNGLQTIGAAQVARGFVRTGTVRGVDPTPGTNPLQAQDVTGDGATTRPDLISVEFFAGNVNGTPSGAHDQVLFTFDEAVLVPQPTITATNPNPGCDSPAVDNDDDVFQGECFALYKADGTEVFANQPGSNPPARAPGNDTQVIVTFPEGAITEATGASVYDGAVQEAIGTAGVNRTNRADEVAVQGVTFAAGLTTAPDFSACELEVTGRDPISGDPTTFQLVFVFDEDVEGSGATGPAPDKFFVYDDAGSLIPPRTASGGSGTVTPVRRSATEDHNEVVLQGYANQSDLQNIASCGVAEGAVTEEGGTAPNPIGYEIIS